MQHINIEIKARTTKADQIRSYLEGQQARFVGTDHQIDTYFNTPTGRLKLRQGTIEESLIYYERSNQAGPKLSDVLLYHPNKSNDLKGILEQVLGAWVVVDKQREIYFIENVKFHVDQVVGLGSFVEIEAIDKEGTMGQERLLEQCQFYMNALAIQATDLIDVSYSDLLQQAQ